MDNVVDPSSTLFFSCTNEISFNLFDWFYASLTLQKKNSARVLPQALCLLHFTVHPKSIVPCIVHWQALFCVFSQCSSLPHKRTMKNIYIQ